MARWSFIGLGGLWGIGLIAMYHGGSLAPKDFQLALLATVLGELIVATLVAINMASTAISREREDGTLDLLTTTPITQSQYLTGKLRGLIAYLLPLLAVPICTLLLAGVYVLSNALGMGGSQGGPVVAVPVTLSRSTAPINVPLVLAEGGIVAAMVIIPFMAFVVMLGLLSSLDSRGTLSSVVKTVAWVGVISGVVGLCSWNAAGHMSFFGASLGALSPASLVFVTVHPEGLDEAIESAGLEGARVALFVGAAIAAAVYIAIVYGIHAHMVRTFDQKVRKLAGAR
jgi:ABC-type Na+ efflux pump permease subunit